MLVLSRKTGEKIVVGHDVVITVLEARGDTIKLGIQAPKTISVHREEVYRDIMQANQAAQAAAPSTDVQSILREAEKTLARPKPVR
jgi:carbon storage regulator